MPKIEAPESKIPALLKGLHLFHFDGAPCAQRVRFALGEKGLSRGREEKYNATSSTSIAAEENRWISRVVSLPKKEHMTPTFAAINPNMVVPALVHDGTLYLESIDIIEYLDEAFGGPRLIPSDPDIRSATFARVEEAKRLHVSIRYVSFRWGLGRLAILKSKERDQLSKLANKGEDAENLVSFYDKYSQSAIPESIYLEHLTHLFTAFSDLDRHLADGRQFLMSDDLTIADAFWSMKVLKMIECGYPIQAHHPRLFEWYQRIYRRPAFQNEVMGKNKLGNRIFRMKSAIEKLIGNGLHQAVIKVANQRTGSAG